MSWSNRKREPNSIYRLYSVYLKATQNSQTKNTKVKTVEKILQQIRETEAHADTLIAEAKEKAAMLAAKGKTDADAFVAQRRSEILAEKTQAINERKKELEKEQQKWAKKAEKQAEDLAANAEKNKKKAVSFFVSEFKNFVKKE